MLNKTLQAIRESWNLAQLIEDLKGRFFSTKYMYLLVPGQMHFEIKNLLCGGKIGKILKALIKSLFAINIADNV